MEILYQVIWHEENQTGVPEHVMGASPLFPTRQAAEDWLNSTMAEDRERAGENEEDLIVENLGDGVWKTVGNNQHCFYRIETDEVPDGGERADRVEALIDTLNRLAELRLCDEMRKRIADYYREVQRTASGGTTSPATRRRTAMSKPLNVALALDLSLQHISQLIEMLDVNGYCQDTKTLKEARDFEEELMKFARYRKCCHNCAHCRPDDGALHVGKTEDPLACFAVHPPFYIEGVMHGVFRDPGMCGASCENYSCKYEGGKE